MNHEFFCIKENTRSNICWPNWDLLSTSVKVKQIAYTGCGGLGKLTEGKNNIREIERE